MARLWIYICGPIFLIGFIYMSIYYYPPPILLYLCNFSRQISHFISDMNLASIIFTSLLTLLCSVLNQFPYLHWYFKLHPKRKPPYKAHKLTGLRFAVEVTRVLPKKLLVLSAIMLNPSFNYLFGFSYWQLKFIPHLEPFRPNAWIILFAFWQWLLLYCLKCIFYRKAYYVTDGL